MYYIYLLRIFEILKSMTRSTYILFISIEL